MDILFPKKIFFLNCTRKNMKCQHLGKTVYTWNKFGDYVELIYNTEHEIKVSLETGKCDSYLDLYLEIDTDGQLRIKHYDKAHNFRFPIVNIPFLCDNIQHNQHMEYISSNWYDILSLHFLWLTDKCIKVSICMCYTFRVKDGIPIFVYARKG